jgi:hypothetical protein
LYSTFGKHGYFKIGTWWLFTFLKGKADWTPQFFKVNTSGIQKQKVLNLAPVLKRKANHLGDTKKTRKVALMHTNLQHPTSKLNTNILRGS